MASIISYTKDRIDALLRGKVDVPVGGVDGQSLVKSGASVIWATITGGGGGSSSATDLTSGTLSVARLADASITETKLATQTMMTSSERQKLSGVASSATANRSDADTDTLLNAKAANAGSIRVALWNGSVYQVNGVTVTSSNRPTGSYIEFQNGPDPTGVTPSLGVVNGDTWKAAS